MRPGIFKCKNTFFSYLQGCNCIVAAPLRLKLLSHLYSCEIFVRSACKILTRWRPAYIVWCLCVNLTCVIELGLVGIHDRMFVVSHPQVSCQDLSEQVSQTPIPLCTSLPLLYALSCVLTSLVPCWSFHLYDVSLSYLSLVHFLCSPLKFSHF